jgi:predicted TIM-barrel fold metal-dependent hydrolase
MLNDCHIHYIPQELGEKTTFYKGPWTDKNKLLDFLTANKIDKAFLVYPSTDASNKMTEQEEAIVYNEAAKNLMNQDNRIIAAGILDFNDEENLHEQVEVLAQDGFKAVSVASSHKGNFILPKLSNLFAACEKHKLAIFVHPQAINPIGFDRVKDPLLMPVLEYSFDVSMCLGLLMMEGILEKYNINFIFASLGGVIPFLKDRFDRVYPMLLQRGMVKDLGKLPSQILKRVYVDTSGASLKNIELAIELFGEEHILWGSDYPVNPPPEHNLSMLDALGDIAKTKVTRDNFVKLFSL